ncbi:hypothetical protein [Treponema pedis]|uniref:V-type ATP synthase subunit E n=1 Tax=Treponema pedis TaxID=409322 RepID=A0A7S7AXX4_9SPIR|nr:hypothetical protein [Treponema pedis]QOW62031.1 hypothetical protein IFE08_06785 [Treponema pedis]
MEELRSTEILDKEIKEDARKKAERILKNADAEAQNILNAVPLRIKNIKKEKASFYAKKAELYKIDAEAAVPLEKLRKKISYIDTEIQKALENYFEKIGEEARLKIILSFVNNFKNFIKDFPVKVKFSNYSKEKIQSLIEENFKDFKVKEYQELSPAEAELTGLKDGIFIEDCNNTFVCKASIDEAKSRLLNEKRAELKEALFGGERIER